MNTINLLSNGIGLLLTTVSLAQNTATAQGSFNNAIVNQSGPDTRSNLGEISQQGTRNFAEIANSSGTTRALAEIFQGNDTRTTGNNLGTTAINVRDNSATIEQSGSIGNTGQIRQFSHANSALIFQIDISINNKALLVQGDGVNLTQSGGNEAFVGQYNTSESNTASAIQSAQGGTLDLRQANFASNNQASIDQVSGIGLSATLYQGGGATGNTASISQYGTYHQATLKQENNSVSNLASIQQGSAWVTNSAYNNANLYQQNASRGQLTITQNTVAGGDNNYTLVYQYGSELITVDNVATVDQQGSQNKTNLFQTGEGANSASIGQYGAYNQVGGSYEGYFAQQNGLANQMHITQSAVDATITLYNSASLSQIGTLNSLSLSQGILAGADGGNTASLSQNGTMNTASVTQVSGTAP